MGDASHDPKGLTEFAVDFLTTHGACDVGVAITENLAGGPPSVDLEYVLPEAKSAVSFAVPMDQDKIERYLAKEDHAGHEQDNICTDTYVTGLAAKLADYWNQIGIPSVGVSANSVYRHDTPRGRFDFMPDISHRYIAAAAGVGWFGLSGNIITRSNGASVTLGTVLTTAELAPTAPISDEENYCDECRLCLASCTSSMMDPSEKTTVRMGEKDFSYSKRRTYHRCDLVCGGFTGLANNGKWSTWSPGRFEVPEDENEFRAALIEAIKAAAPRPPIGGGTFHPALRDFARLNMTCGNCQLLCHPDREERERRYRLLTSSGVVVQKPDGSLEAVTPEEAEKRLAELPPERRAMYVKE
jgi:epoxyqueuosine reductase QueG